MSEVTKNIPHWSASLVDSAIVPYALEGAMGNG